LFLDTRIGISTDVTLTAGAALRLSDQYTRSRLDVLVDQLRDRHLLLILDTCEPAGRH